MTAAGNGEFVEVVPSAPFAAADEAFRQWLRGVGVERSDLADEDVRIDAVRGLDGRSLRRYLVRRRAIPSQDG